MRLERDDKTAGTTNKKNHKGNLPFFQQKCDSKIY